METFWGVISLLLVVAFIGAVGLLFYLVFGLWFAARKGLKHANLERQRLRVESLRDLFPAPRGVKYSRERVYS